MREAVEGKNSTIANAPGVACLPSRSSAAMGPPPLSAVKPSARKRTALARGSSARVRTAAQDARAAARVLRTEDVGGMVAERELERTYKVGQGELAAGVGEAVKRKMAFELDMSATGLGPYVGARYSRSGRALLLCGRKGHVSCVRWREGKLDGEIFLGETVRDACFLHNDAFYAVAQKKYVYVYDSSGAQVHVLRKHRDPGCVVSLPYHLLLASASCASAKERRLTYTDTSTGEIVGELDYAPRALNLGAVADAAVNAANGVVHMGHSNGVVSLWSPAANEPLARIFTHSGGVRNIVVAPNGRWMVTSGADSKVKIWDLRTYKMAASWTAPALTTALTVSQRGLVGMGFGATVQIWAAAAENGVGRAGVKGHAQYKTNDGWSTAPYMVQQYPGTRISGLDFCPYEDLLAVCHDKGMATMAVPGAGEATFDSRAPNPYETQKQRRENEVHMLLDKLPPASIALDATFVGGVDDNPAERLKEIQTRAREANATKRDAKTDVKRAKGRNKIGKRLRRKQDNVIDAKRLELEDKLKKQREMRDAAKQIARGDAANAANGTGQGLPALPPVPDALRRFFPKPSS